MIAHVVPFPVVHVVFKSAMSKYIIACCLLSNLWVYSQPLTLVSQSYAGPTFNIKLHGEYCYTVSGFTVKVVDFSEPVSPVQVYQYELSSPIIAITFLADTLLLADKEEISAYAIDNPISPELLGVYTHNHRFTNLESYNGLVYAFSVEDGMEIFDYSDVSNPELLFSIDCGPTPREAVFQDTLLFVCSMDRVSCFSTSDPENPYLLDAIEFSLPKLNLALLGNYAYVTNSTAGLRVVNISDPTNLTLIQTIPVAADCRGVAIQEQHAFATDIEGIIYSVNISFPGNAFIEAELDLSDEHVGAHDVLLNQEHVLVANEGDGIQVIDISDPVNLEIIGNFDVPAATYGIEKQGENIYIASLTDGLRIVDVSDVYSPHDVCSDFLPGSAWNLSFHDSLVIVPMVDASEVYFVDVSDPVSPNVVGVAQDQLQDAITSGNLLVGAGIPDELLLTDISDFENPIPLGSIEFERSPWSVVCRGQYAYLAHVFYDESDSLSVIDLSDPEEPQLVRSIPIESPYDLVIKDDLLLVAARGLHIFTLHDPANPVEIGSSEYIADWCRGVAVSGDFAYLACLFSAEVKVFNIHDVAHPVEVASFFYGDYAGVEDVAAWDDLFAVTGAIGGFCIVRNELWSQSVGNGSDMPFLYDMMLLPAAPNPFNNTTTLRFQLPLSQHIKVDLFDVNGRYLQCLTSDFFQDGEHALTLNGTDLASGMYFVRITGSGGAKVQKISLLK